MFHEIRPSPIRAPLPCFGLEYTPGRSKCIQCPYASDCKMYMGVRLDKVPLNQVLWNIVPESYAVEAYGQADDLEQPHLERLYLDCFKSVFGKVPSNVGTVSLIKQDLVKNAIKAGCSVRLFMLSNMVAHKQLGACVVEHTEQMKPAPFKPEDLVSEYAVSRCLMYREICAREFGTYTPTSLEILVAEKKESSKFESLLDGLLSSEITAAKNLIAHKIHHSGPWESAAYESDELSLVPEWLALESDYVEKILNPFLKDRRKHRVTRVLCDHRYAVLDTLKYYKKNPSLAKTAWLWRQQMMPRAVVAVLHFFNLHSDDFLYTRKPVRKTMDFWKTLALTIRHYHCWLYVQGLSSVYRERVLRKLPRPQSPG